MRLLRFVCIALLAGCASVPRPASTLRVLVYNIHAGKDASGIDNLERVAQLITSSDADLVLLQEVDRNTTRSGNVDQLATLMRLTKRYGAMGKSLDYQGGDYGIATLSRWPIVRHEVIKLRVDPPQVRAGGSLEPRVALVVETRTPGRTLRVVNTHLDASREDRYRLQEADDLLRSLATLRGATLLGGDFNSTPDSAVHEKIGRSDMRDAWIDCGRGNEETFPADVPVKRIDYLWLSGRAQCTSAAVIESQASDHRPLLVTLSVR